MKKIKLFALAIMAMLSTNAFAAAYVTHECANTVFRFVITKDYTASPEKYGSCQIIGFVADVDPANVTTTVIPAFVNGTAPYEGKYKVVGIADGAFEGKAITTIDLTAAENLGDKSLVDENLANPDDYVGIGAGAFAGTGITTLDLTATKLVTLNPLFETTNTKVTTIKLPTTLKTIGNSAFEGLSALNSITFAEQTIPGAKYDLTIGEDAFVNTMALTTLTLPANVKAIGEGAFANTYLTTLEIKGDITSDGVAVGAFAQNGTQTIELTYKPSDDAVAAAFAQKAFAPNGDKDPYVTFKTTTAFGGKLVAAFGDAFYGVNLVYDTPADGQITVYNQGGKFSYGTWYDDAQGIAIAKKQGENKDINVMVYGAYVDAADETAILMDQMHLVGGVYYIQPGTPIIVKSSSDAKVEYNNYADAEDSQNYKYDSTDPQNEIQVYGEDWGTGDDTYAVNVINNFAPETVIFLLPLDETTFGWSEFSNNRIVKDHQFYLLGKDGAPSRVIWLDGSEEDQVTAIKTVKSAKAENGAIFNLAGQKVNAAYKGVVIKEGKKYIQK